MGVDLSAMIPFLFALTLIGFPHASVQRAAVSAGARPAVAASDTNSNVNFGMAKPPNAPSAILGKGPNAESLAGSKGTDAAWQGTPSGEKGDEAKRENKRIFGIVPANRYLVSGKFSPLTPREKFGVFADDTFDRFTIVSAGVEAGLGQALDTHPGYGQGGEGFAKRFGAAAGDIVTGDFFRKFFFPTLFKQDPRYFQLGRGTSTGHRIGYAISRVLVTMGDSGRRQINASNILGSFASAGISNAYYPADERGVGLTFQRAGVGLGYQAAFNVLAEFSRELRGLFTRK